MRAPTPSLTFSKGSEKIPRDGRYGILVMGYDLFEDEMVELIQLININSQRGAVGKAPSTCAANVTVPHLGTGWNDFLSW